MCFVPKILYIFYIYFRVPEAFKEISIREKGFIWKNVKNLFICSLHLEAKCFTNKRRLKLSAADLVAQSSEHVEQPPAVIPDHDNSQPMELQEKPTHVPPSDHDYCQPMEQEQPVLAPEQQTTTDLEHCQPTEQREQPSDDACVSDGDLKLQIEKLKSELSQLKKNKAESETKLKRSNKGLKRRCAELKLTISDLKIKLDELHRKFEIDAFVDTIKKCVSQVPLEIFEATIKRVNGSKLKNYHPAIKRFALNLHTCSAKAYR